MVDSSAYLFGKICSYPPSLVLDIEMEKDALRATQKDNEEVGTRPSTRRRMDRGISEEISEERLLSL